MNQKQQRSEPNTNKKEQSNFRLNPDSVEKFRVFCENNNITRAEGFDFMMQLIETEKAKDLLPARKTEIEIFMMYLKKIQGTYLHCLEVNHSAEERIEEKFKTDIKRNLRTIDELREKNDLLQTEKAQALKSAEDSAAASAQALKDADTARLQADTANKLVAEKDNTIFTLHSELHAAQEKAELYDMTAAQLDEALDASSEKDKTIDGLNIKIKDLQRDLSDAKKDANFAVAEKNALIKTLEEKLSASEKRAGMYEETAAKLEEANGKIKDLQHEVSDVKKDAEHAATNAVLKAEVENARLQTRIEMLEAQIQQLTHQEPHKNSN